MNPNSLSYIHGLYVPQFQHWVLARLGVLRKLVPQRSGELEEALAR